MKKTITLAALALALGLAASASAATSRVDFNNESVTTTYVTNTQTVSTLTASEDISLSSANTNGKWFDSTTTFTLDLDALNSLEIAEGSVVTLVTLTSSGDSPVSVGLGVRSVDGANQLTLMWNGSRWNSNSKNPGWALNGSGTYSLITEYNSAGSACTYLFDSGASTPAGLGQSSGLGTTSGTLSLSSVSVDSNYVTSFAVSNATLNITAAGIGGAATALHNAAVPEPTTATLSLLALAGLAARRRRK